MGMKRIELGPVGENVAVNVQAYREKRGLTYAELSRRLAGIVYASGQPSRQRRDLAPLALRQIEAGARRVDVDDLVALGMVLGVDPLALMLPHPLDEAEMMQIVDRIATRKEID